MLHHPMKRNIRRDRQPPAWPSYTGVSQFAGTSADYYDPTLGPPGAANAAALVNDASRIAAANDAIFGTPGGGGDVSVIVFAIGGMTDGTGGADHMGCDYRTGNAIEVCAAFGNNMMVSALFEAELSECSMNGNLCGLSTGEALSRWCAAIVGNNSLSAFASAPTWAQDGMPEFVNVTDQTDQNYDSIGCGMAFLSWLQTLGYPLSKIAPEMVFLRNSGTLARLYTNLTRGDVGAWGTFMAAVKALPGGIVSDDPFGALAAPIPAPPPPIPAPPPAPNAAKVIADLRAISALLGDIAANI